MIGVKRQPNGVPKPSPVDETPRLQDARKRRYASSEQQRLTDLFGTPERWGNTLQSLLWTQVQLLVPAFEEQAEAVLPVPVSFDFGIAATRYFHGLEQGELPLLLLFSGNIFYLDAEGSLTMGPIDWSGGILPKYFRTAAVVRTTAVLL